MYFSHSAKSRISRLMATAIGASFLVTGLAAPLTAQADPPDGCTLSPLHVVYNDEKSATDNPFVTLGWQPSASYPVDPDNTNSQIRTAGLSALNKSQHTFYNVAYFLGYFGFFLQDAPSGPINWTDWDNNSGTFKTSPSATWPSGWAPRDTATPGVATAGLRDSTYPAAILDIPPLVDALGTKLPGYLLSDIAPGTTASWSQAVSATRPVNNGAYAWNNYRYIMVQTCMPTPTVDTPSVPNPSVLTGTGSYAGDTIVITDNQNNPLGTVTVSADLTWSLTLPEPLDSGVLQVGAEETDEFGFTGVASAVPPLPSVSVGDFVWHDVNHNGVQDSGEPGLAGIQLTITGPDGPVTNILGNTVGPVTSAASGSYLFADLPLLESGQRYAVTLNSSSLPSGYLPTLSGEGDGTNGSFDGSAAAGDLDTHGDANMNLDFGFFLPIDLSIDKTLKTTGDVSGGTTVTFTLSPSNIGPGDALAGWTVKDAIPAGLTMTGMSGTGYTCDVPSRECIAQETLAAGAEAPSITVTAVVSADALGELSNRAVITAAEADVPETDLENNTAVATFEVVKAAVSPSGPASPTPSLPVAPPNSAPSLPNTGGPASELPLIGVILVLVGLGLASRRRRTPTTI